MNMYPQKTWKQTKNNLNQDPSAPEISLPTHPKPLPTQIPLEYTLISTRKTKGSGRRIFSIFREEKFIIRKKKEETPRTLISIKETEEIDESFRKMKEILARANLIERNESSGQWEKIENNRTLRWIQKRKQLTNLVEKSERKARWRKT